MVHGRVWGDVASLHGIRHADRSGRLLHACNGILNVAGQALLLSPGSLSLSSLALDERLASTAQGRGATLQGFALTSSLPAQVCSNAPGFGISSFRPLIKGPLVATLLATRASVERGSNGWTVGCPRLCPIHAEVGRIAGDGIFGEAKGMSRGCGERDGGRQSSRGKGIQGGQDGQVSPG